MAIWGQKRKVDRLTTALGDRPLPTFPAVVFKVLGAIRDPDSSPQQIARILSADPGLTIRLLKMANSPAFGRDGRIDNVSHAVVLLGCRQVEQIVLSVVVGDALPKRDAPGFQHQRFWRAAARRASAAQALADLLHPASAALSFTAALLQDMAIPLLAHRGPAEYGEILEDWHRGGGDLTEVEQSTFGWGHAEIAGKLCGSWSFPDVLSNAIAGHHTSESDVEGIPPAVRLVALIPETDGADDAVIAQACDDYGLGADSVTEALAESRERADSLARLFAA